RVGWLNLALLIPALVGIGWLLASSAGLVASAPPIPSGPPDVIAIATAAGLLFFTFTGYARLATLAGELEEPARTLPRVIWLSIGLVALLLLGLCAVAWASSVQPEPVDGTARLILVWSALPTLLGVLVSQILGMSRVVAAMGSAGDLPRFVSRTNTGGAPIWGVAIAGLGGMAGILFSGSALAAASTLILLYYAVTHAASLRLAESPIRVPAWAAWIGLFACVSFAAVLAWSGSWPWALAAVALGLAIRTVRLRISALEANDPQKID
ncbi:MAG: hypothetical protein MH204_02235, partial [Fimbriimonadaceae bacterium]|nr:hypothetical protein [Fimbriimonadaceae bacterium]